MYFQNKIIFFIFKYPLLKRIFSLYKYQRSLLCEPHIVMEKVYLRGVLSKPANQCYGNVASVWAEEGESRFRILSAQFKPRNRWFSSSSLCLYTHATHKWEYERDPLCDSSIKGKSRARVIRIISSRLSRTLLLN